MARGSKKPQISNVFSVGKVVVDDEQQAQTYTGDKLITSDDAILHAKNETFNESIPQKDDDVVKETYEIQKSVHVIETDSVRDKENKAKEKTEVKKYKKTKLHNQYDPASILFNKIGNKKQRVGDTRVRRTYWLTQEEIDMVDKLADMTGMDKYEVVSLAIKSMYVRALEEKRTK